MSPHQHVAYLGNPSHEDFGIDQIFKQSDQRYWFRKCTHCGKEPPHGADYYWFLDINNGWTCAEKSFPGCIKIRNDGTGYVGCGKCGKEVLTWTGLESARWVPEFPEKTNYMQGYQASQLMHTFHDPADILEAFVNPPFGNLADVYRLKLGRAYSDKAEKLRKSTVLANCGPDSPALNHKGPCAMGVDVGKAYHAVVIGIKNESGRYEIIRTIKAKDFQEVHNLARRFNVESTVIDIRPYEEEARAYQKSHGGDCTNPAVFLCEYSDTQITDATYNNNSGIVKVGKTEIFDHTHKLLSMGRIVLPAQCPEIEEFARQCCNCAKFEEKDKRKNTIIFRYRKTGDRQDDFRSALNYFVLAAKGHRLGVAVSQYASEQFSEVDNEYDRT